jgi:hypothetical protein
MGIFSPHLQYENKIKHYVQQFKQVLTSLHEFAFSRPKSYPENPLYPFQPGDQILLKTWRNQSPDNQLTEKRTGSYNVRITTTPP